jgi:mannose-6-phosphate isomerase
VLYPLTFHPIFKERVWGGRELEKLFGKPLPAGKPIGESWEISDRPGDASVIANGPLAGKNLRWLMEHHAAEILGGAKPAAEGRFPLLCKILDAREKLSLQVHPKPGSAGVSPAGSEKRRQDGSAPGGEPKTELWFIADAEPGAELFLGLKRGATRESFEQKIRSGEVADCLHRVSVRAGDAMFLPSGRVHAIGAGLVIFEIQQNSDTTYRVFDWNRVGLDGRPRELHIPQSLASIDFNDFEPKLVRSEFAGPKTLKERKLAENPLFNVTEFQAVAGSGIRVKPDKLEIITVIHGEVRVGGRQTGATITAGQFCLIPACLKGVEIEAKPQTTFLCVEAN